MDVDGDGRLDNVVRAWRENFNAHGYDHYTFYLLEEAPSTAKPRWHLVPFSDPTGAPDRDTVNNSGGADCLISDLRVLRPTPPGRGPVTVLWAERELGESYSEEGAVTFTVYRIARNDDEAPGSPAVYFKRQESFTATRQYCDVTEAFREELAIGP